MKKIIAILAVVLFTGTMAASAANGVIEMKAKYAITDEDPKKKETAKKSECASASTEAKGCETKSAEAKGCETKAAEGKSCESKSAEAKSGCCDGKK